MPHRTQYLRGSWSFDFKVRVYNSVCKQQSLFVKQLKCFQFVATLNRKVANKRNNTIQKEWALP